MPTLTVKGLRPAALAQLLRESRHRIEPDEPLHVYICIADHFEPMWQRPPKSVALERVRRWVEEYPKLADQFEDSQGNKPQHTFFYPQDEYDPELVEPIARLCEQGYGDMEVHLHHDHDTPDGLREKLETFTHTLHDKHGMLRRDENGQIRYAFIHGNWALNNSRPDGRWCGVDDETSILLETGCYCDMTMPSAPSPCQTSMINSIYYAKPDKTRRKGHDRGVLARLGEPPPENSLLMIQGPLALDFGSRKWGVLPRLENGDLTARRPPTMERLKLWLANAPRLAGLENHVFIKLHTHGAQERNAGMLLGEQMLLFHNSLRRAADRLPCISLHYVSANRMANVITRAVGPRSTCTGAVLTVS